jgi:hypothetical protein
VRWKAELRRRKKARREPVIIQQHGCDEGKLMNHRIPDEPSRKPRELPPLEWDMPVPARPSTSAQQPEGPPVVPWEARDAGPFIFGAAIALGFGRYIGGYPWWLVYFFLIGTAVGSALVFAGSSLSRYHGQREHYTVRTRDMPTAAPYSEKEVEVTLHPHIRGEDATPTQKVVEERHARIFGTAIAVIAGSFLLAVLWRVVIGKFPDWM